MFSKLKTKMGLYLCVMAFIPISSEAITLLPVCPDGTAFTPAISRCYSVAIGKNDRCQVNVHNNEDFYHCHQEWEQDSKDCQALCDAPKRAGFRPTLRPAYRDQPQTVQKTRYFSGNSSKEAH